MKRALAVAALFLAACSSGNKNEAPTAAPVADVAETSTTTTTPETAFLDQLGRRITDRSPEFEEAATGLAKSMCDLLDGTQDVDPTVTAQLTDMAMAVASDTGADPQVTRIVLRYGADAFCPEHAAVVYEYTDSMG